MIADPITLNSYPVFQGVDGGMLQRRLAAIENAVCAYTNNDFRSPYARFYAISWGGILHGFSPYIAVGDTVRITGSVNSGLYVVTAADEEAGTVTLDRAVYDAELNLVAKVEYPPDVVEGALNLLQWELTGRDKVGIQSETISRHSVTYFNLDGADQLNGYPAALLGFLKPYEKARF